MTFFELILPLIPNHGDKICAGNVRFWNDQGELCYDKPTEHWDKQAVITDISVALLVVRYYETDKTSSSFAA